MYKIVYFRRKKKKIMFISRIKNNYKSGEPIFVQDAISLFPEYTRAYIFRLLKRNEKSGNIVRFSRGVYCLPKKTFFGTTTTTSSMVAKNKYVSDDKLVYGIYSGLTLLNQFAISSQVPNVLEIVTNNESTRKRTIYIDGIKFIIRKSRFEITKDNYCYYTILQLFLELGVNPKLDDFAKQRIVEYISKKRINKNELIKYAMRFPAQAIKNLMGSEVLNGIV